MKDVLTLTPGELVHRMMVAFRDHRVSKDRDDNVDEYDSMYLQDKDYYEAADRLDSLLKTNETHRS
jgi:hypothetical protein